MNHPFFSVRVHIALYSDNIRKPSVWFSLSLLGIRQPCKHALTQWQALSGSFPSLCLFSSHFSPSCHTFNVWGDTAGSEFHIQKAHLVLWIQHSSTLWATLLSLGLSLIPYSLPFIVESFFILLKNEDKIPSSPFLTNNDSYRTEHYGITGNCGDGLNTSIHSDQMFSIQHCATCGIHSNDRTGEIPVLMERSIYWKRKMNNKHVNKHG